MYQTTPYVINIGATHKPRGKHRHRAADATPTKPFVASMSVELKSRPRPPIIYKRKIHIPGGVDIESLEFFAWRAWDKRVRVPKNSRYGVKGRLTRTVSAIQQQIIEQYGWPEQE